MKTFELYRIAPVNPTIKDSERGKTQVLGYGMECVEGGLVLFYWKDFETSGTYPNMERFKAVHCSSNSVHNQVVVFN